MDHPRENPTHLPHDPSPRARRSLWRAAGGGSLTISLIIHGVLVAVGAIWIMHVAEPAEKEMIITGRSAGGDPSSSEKRQQQQQARMMPPELSRIAAAGASGLVLPEPAEVSRMVSLGSMNSGGMAGGMGGSSGTGGKGNGGIGNTFDGSSILGGGNSGTVFGVPTLDKNALAGTFYDLKQTSDRKPTGMTDSRMREELMEITRRGFSEKSLEKYFKAPRKLYRTKFFIPVMPADGAPAAFEVEKEVQPQMWLAVYRGTVQAPKSGRFRFVGECDDLMVIRFNDRPVFDYGYTMAGTGIHVNGRAGDFDGSRPENRELSNEVHKLTPNRLPMTFYKYANTPKHNEMIGGLAVGAEFTVEAGKTYPVDIMIGEIPGGYFSATLLIEEVGAKYEKDAAGFPILPLFRLDHSVPAADGGSAPFDPDGPVWKFAPGASKPGI